MKRDERQVVHELAEHYGLASESQDPEPQRNVVIYRGVIKSAIPKIPKPTLTEYMRQGSGQRARALIE
jgi:transcriptional repressor NF-X1